MVHIHTGLVAISSYLMFGATLFLMFKNVTFNFIVKFWGGLADQPGSVVV